MDPLLILQYAIQYGPLIKGIIDSAVSNEDVVTKVLAISKPFATLLEGIGAKLFPQVAAQLHIAAAVTAAFDPNVTKWLQGSLNVLLDPSPNLTVDGIYGQKTKAAVIALQKQLGLDPDGWAGQLTQAAIQAALAAKLKLAQPAPVTPPTP